MPPRIVRNEETAANYGRWVAGLRREVSRKAHDRHQARAHVRPEAPEQLRLPDTLAPSRRAPLEGEAAYRSPSIAEQGRL